MINNTNYYWRKKLDLDSPPDRKVLLTSILGRLFRPFFFFLFKYFIKYYAPLEVTGIENLPQKYPYILAPNHISLLDYPVLVNSIDPSIRKDYYVLSTSAFYDVFIARIFMKWVANVIRINIHDDFFVALRKAASVLRLNKVIILYPEGTRSSDGELLEFKTGLGVLSVECNAPIVPAYVAGLEDILPRHAFFPRRGKIKLAFGKPIYPEEFKKNVKEEQAYYLYKEVTEKVKDSIAKLRESIQ